MPTVLDVALMLLVVQGALGAFDVLYNHEWDARLPTRPNASVELRIHSVRAVLYALVFAGIAWFDWLDWFAWLFAAVILVEIVLTLWDFVVEDRTRSLSRTERVVHTVLAMNGGAYVGLLIYASVTTLRRSGNACGPPFVAAARLRRPLNSSVGHHEWAEGVICQKR